MRGFKRGDWVVFVPGCKAPEIGRVAGTNYAMDACYVCYSHGCTSALTANEMLVPYDPDEFPDLVPDVRIGYHRFDPDGCPDYEPGACDAYCKRAEPREES